MRGRGERWGPCDWPDQHEVFQLTPMITQLGRNLGSRDSFRKILADSDIVPDTLGVERSQSRLPEWWLRRDPGLSYMQRHTKDGHSFDR
jgi:hypothetical protein